MNTGDDSVEPNLLNQDCPIHSYWKMQEELVPILARLKKLGI